MAAQRERRTPDMANLHTTGSPRVGVSADKLTHHQEHDAPTQSTRAQHQMDIVIRRSKPAVGNVTGLP
jgi:hypothetical protein